MDEGEVVDGDCSAELRNEEEFAGGFAGFEVAVGV